VTPSEGLVSVTNSDRVSIVAIENSTVKNALDDGTRKSLLAALKAVTSDPCTGAVVLTGSAGTFCSGGELRSMPTDPDKIRSRLGEMHEIARLIHIGPKPVVAAVDGAAYGSGLSLACACDHIVASTDASFGCTFARVGLIADTGLLSTLPGRLSGPHARSIVLRGSILTATRAFEIGLVDELAEPGDAINCAIRQAQSWSETAPLAFAASKRLLAPTFEDLLRAEMEEQVGLLMSSDFAEGRAAFLDRRRPRFGSA
jgi:2-(1,2-epoxy-1,2-dihydrophenyl)acetyl-CoA isomerase